jgi:acetylornithine/succinyldiaminopimelate/putrescine aminotransferase/predicted amino acid dehydrogenase
MSDEALLYRQFVKPELGRLFGALRLDLNYVQGQGDLLTWQGEDGAKHEVLDFLGGYGASLFGHNHPRLVEALCGALRAGRVFNAQKSCRGSAGKLAEQLSLRVGAFTGQSYVTTFANSGAEAVEAAIKHAALAYSQRCDQERRTLSRALSKVVARWRRGELRVSAAFSAVVRRKLSTLGPTRDLAQIADTVLLASSRALAQPPLFVALSHAFHGLTSGAMQLTAAARYRAPFTGVGVQTLRLDASSEHALQALLRDASMDLFELGVENGELCLIERKKSNIGALFIETLQGEGGIRTMPAAVARSLRAAADAHGFPLVCDEIQSGMGRTGTFLHCEQLGLRPDYVLLGKSLGGGLTKLGALLVDRRLYCDDFSLAHSSTFAEDDLSASVGLEALALLDADGVPQRCAELGELAKSGLSTLAAKYPEVIEEIRGSGLMLGVALRDFRHCSSLPLQMLAEQEMLGYLISGYLLHGHGIRVGPTLSQAGTIRIEPSAYVTPAQLSRLLLALEDLCQQLRAGDVAHMVSFLLPQVEAREPRIELREPMTWSRELPRTGSAFDELPQVGFVAHFAGADDVCDWEPSFARLTKKERETLLDRLHDVLDPMVHDRTVVRSAQGHAVCLNVIGLCIDARLMSQYLRGRERRLVLQQLQKAVELAEGLGCSVVGLGGYTSILAGNGLLLKNEHAALTTGNSLTVGMGLAAIRRAADSRGVALGSARFGAVGAAGNIASIYSELISREVSSVHLIGRSEGLARVRETAGRLLRNAGQEAMAYVAGTADRPTGIGISLLSKNSVDLLRETQIWQLSDAALFQAFSQALADKCPVSVGDDLKALINTDVILTASNAADPLLRPETVGEQPTIICDISVPPDAHPTLEQRRPNAVVIQGGVVQMPNNPDFHPAGSPLPPGRCYACLAETTLLGLEGVRESFSYGMISPERVQRAMELAERHGFTLAESALQRRGYNLFSRAQVA